MTQHGEVDLALDSQLCFALYAASRAMTGCYRPLLDDLGLTYPQYLVLLVLWQEEPLTVGELGRRLQLDSGTLSPLLKRLASNGLLVRTRSPDDERAVQVDLTPEGRALRERAVTIPPAMIDASGLSPAELTELRDALRTLTARLRGTAAT